MDEDPTTDSPTAHDLTSRQLSDWLTIQQCVVDGDQCREHDDVVEDGQTVCATFLHEIVVACRSVEMARRNMKVAVAAIMNDIKDVLEKMRYCDNVHQSYYVRQCFALLESLEEGLKVAFKYPHYQDCIKLLGQE